jgi:hypothetical protein
MSAVISACGLYRYALQRPFPLRPVERVDAGRLLWVMLNPSTADAEADDPTVRRCRGYSEAWGYRGFFTVVNLYALRATDPRRLRDAEDPVGPDNDRHVRWAAHLADVIVLAWGRDVGPQPGRVAEVLELLRPYSRKLRALGYAKSGQPRHPLMMASGVAPIDWRAA